jgi:arginine repressor
MEMTKLEMIQEVLRDHSCLTANEIAGYIYRRYGEHISPASVSGSIRTLYAKGEADRGRGVKGNTIYWLTNNNEKWVQVK